MTAASIQLHKPGFSLRQLHGAMFVLHAVQAIAIVALSTSFSLPVTTSFLVFDEGLQKLVPETKDAFNVQLAILVASFSFVSATAHLITILPGVHEWYLRKLDRGINYLRWFEYAVSASIMIVAIGLLVGVYDLGSLILMFALNATMIFCGLIMEVHNQTTAKTNWTSFVVGCFAGAIPWVVISLYLFAPATRSAGDVPTFVYGIYASLFVWFNLFAVNMWLQYRRIGPWRDYLFGERAYIFLSLTAKSALAWQVFAGTLRGV
jgi:hypothetical protein